jgi:hypothetical protein
MKTLVTISLLALLSSETKAFILPPGSAMAHFAKQPVSLVSLSDEPNQEEASPPQSLILDSEEMEAKMRQLKSKYPTSEADYLAAARARAKAKPESREIAATQEDFERVAEEKKKQGLLDMDDWEASATEAGNADSQILFLLPDDESDDNEGGAEPKLLL